MDFPGPLIATLPQSNLSVKIIFNEFSSLIAEEVKQGIGPAAGRWGARADNAAGHTHVHHLKNYLYL